MVYLPVAFIKGGITLSHVEDTLEMNKGFALWKVFDTDGLSCVQLCRHAIFFLGVLMPYIS